jgi:hypothetical protein
LLDIVIVHDKLHLVFNQKVLFIFWRFLFGDCSPGFRLGFARKGQHFLTDPSEWVR